jgi:hypothetical protein
MKKATTLPDLFVNNYENDPVFQWLFDEIYHSHSIYLGSKFDPDSVKDLRYRIIELERLAELKTRCRDYLQTVHKIEWRRAEEIIEAIKDATDYKVGAPLHSSLQTN